MKIRKIEEEEEEKGEKKEKNDSCVIERIIVQFLIILGLFIA